MDKDLLLVQVYHPQNTKIGDFIYRIEQPSKAMGQIHVLILHMVSDQDILPVIEERKGLGLPNVFEISDNFVAFQPRDPMRAYFNDPLNLATTFQYINLADGVQVSTNQLAETFSFLNNSIMVFENQLICTGRFPRKNGGNVTIGWAGSLSHLDDLYWIAPTLVKFFESFPDVRFAYMGAEKGYDYFRDIPEKQRSYTKTGSLQDYYCFLETIDIGLAPLLNTYYNRCRSDVKFIEYASCGVVPVLSALPPYTKNATHGVTAFLFADEKELFSVLVQLVRNPNLRKGVARNAYDYAITKRKESVHAALRAKYYRGLCQKNAEKRLPVDVLSPMGPDTEGYVVKETRAEKLVSDATTLYRKGDVAGEWRLYKEAIKSRPDYYIPYFWLGDSMFRYGKDEAIHYLELACRTYPLSLRAKLHLGLALLDRDKEAACGYFSEALRVSALYAPAWDALGRVEEQLGNYQKAVELFGHASKANPFYSLTSLGLARAYLALGKREQAIGALDLADDILPNHIESRLDLAQLLQKAGKAEDATRQCEKVLKEDPRNADARQFLTEISKEGDHKDRLRS